MLAAFGGGAYYAAVAPQLLEACAAFVAAQSRPTRMETDGTEAGAEAAAEEAAAEAAPVAAVLACLAAAAAADPATARAAGGEVAAAVGSTLEAATRTADQLAALDAAAKLGEAAGREAPGGAAGGGAADGAAEGVLRLLRRAATLAEEGQVSGLREAALRACDALLLGSSGCWGLGAAQRAELTAALAAAAERERVPAVKSRGVALAQRLQAADASR